MRILFFGSGHFAIPSLRAIDSSEYDLVGVITQPSRKAGRGGKLRSTPIRLACEELDISADEIANVNAPEAVELFRSREADVICVVDFGQFLRKPVRDTARLGAFNLHGSLLPALRGAAPFNWAIINGLTQTGVTTFSLVDKMDAGDIYLKEELKIQPHETAEELQKHLGEIGAGIVSQTLKILSQNPSQRFQQDEKQVTFAPKLKKSDGIINWSNNAVQLRNLIHGTQPWPGAKATFTHENGKDISIEIVRAEAIKSSQSPASSAIGTVDEDGDVICGSGKLKIIQVKPAGKKLMDWRDFVNGYRIRTGTRFI